MTITPISSRDHRLPVPTSPNGRRPGGAWRRRVSTNSVGTPGGLTITFEITLSGEHRYQDAMEIIDGLRQVTGQLATATLDIAPSQVELAPPDPLTEPFTGRAGRADAEDQTEAQEGYIRIVPDSRTVIVAGQEIALTRVEFDLVTFLAEHPRRVFGREQLLKHVWGYEHTGQRTVDVHIRRIRAKLGQRLVTTIRGVGYRLAADARITVGTRTGY